MSHLIKNSKLDSQVATIFILFFPYQSKLYHILVRLCFLLHCYNNPVSQHNREEAAFVQPLQKKQLFFS
ncbi:hypothetical protein EVA_16596 [gut metagenome]|uniref:Uncharacterized protein n=1 Tax=gut metagenome TaxID=749906 RepID=J9FK65_9ZZZZ